MGFIMTLFLLEKMNVTKEEAGGNRKVQGTAYGAVLLGDGFSLSACRPRKTVVRWRCRVY